MLVAVVGQLLYDEEEEEKEEEEAEVGGSRMACMAR